jgi:hypothetical protein
VFAGKLVDVDRQAGPLTVANRSEEPDRLRGEPPKGELEDTGTRPVDPLHIIDRHDQRLADAQPADGREARGRHQSLVDGVSIRVGMEEGHLDGSSLRGRKLRHDLRQG